MSPVTTGFILSPQVIEDATTYNPFNMPRTNGVVNDTAEFIEDVYFIGATTKEINDQTIVELSLKVAPHSAHNPNVKFRTDIWLHTGVCNGTVRPADLENERDWDTTKKGLRTLMAFQKALGIMGDPITVVDILTDPSTQPTGLANMKIKIWRKNNGQHGWDLRNITKAQG